MRKIVALVAAMLVLSGCMTGGSDKAFMTTPSGAQAARPQGGAVAATIIEQMNGGLVGGDIGTGLGADDKRLALEAEYKALEYTPAGQPVKWQGSGVTGEATAAQPYRVGSQNCRQYSQSVTVNGAGRSARGTACRNADGSWTPLT